jgi:hypothetical protein
MAYMYIDKIVYRQNKKLINKFIDEQDETRITFNKNPDKIGCVEIYVDYLTSFDNFVEYMFRKLRKDTIACVGICCDCFKELKEMNVMIREIHEKMWEEENRRGCIGEVYAKANDYNLIKLLDFYYIYYMYEHDEYNESYKKRIASIEEKINEYRGNINEKTIL